MLKPEDALRNSGNPHSNNSSNAPAKVTNNGKTTPAAATTRKSSKTSRCSGSEHGFFRKAMPVMPKPLAIICCLFNILFPGLGTLISSLSVFVCASHGYDTNLKAFLVNFLAFLLQLCSAIIIFGWIWSIKYGLLFIQLASKSNYS
jgi:hypothetical protein